MSPWGAERFVADLEALGFDDVKRDGSRVSTKWAVALGSRIGEVIEMGWDVPPDWPETPPHGPHVRPAFDHPGGGNHASPFGADWRHWSRPYNRWALDGRTMKVYVRFMTTLLSTT
jgi:hypothetical protein